MQEKARPKYEKPVSIDMGRVAPVLGDTCSVGSGASDCPAGMNNSVVAVCDPNGTSADNDCRTGSDAGTFCWPSGSGAHVYCLVGSDFGGAAPQGMSAPAEESTSGYEYPEPPIEPSAPEGSSAPAE